MTGPGLLPLLRSWWWLIVAAAVAAGALAFVFASQERKTYQADVKLLVGPVSADLPTVQAAGALGRTYAELAHSRPVVVAAARDANVKLTPDQVDKSVTASSNDVTRIVDVQVRNSDPAAAAKIASGVAQQLSQLQKKPPAESGDSVDAIMRDPGVAALPLSAQRAVRSAVVAVVGSPDVGALAVVDAPLRPHKPVSPKVTLLVILAALAGAVVGTVYAVVREGLAASSAGDAFDAFDVETFLPSGTNGGGESMPADEPDELPSRGRS